MERRFNENDGVRLHFRRVPQKSQRDLGFGGEIFHWQVQEAHQVGLWEAPPTIPQPNPNPIIRVLGFGFWVSGFGLGHFRLVQ